MRRLHFPASLRARILGIVVVGAVLPLGVVGWILSRGAAVAAEQRLQAQVDSALERVVKSMAERWQFREADLQLLVQNDVVRRLLELGPRSLTPSDSTYFASLESSLKETVSRVNYRDAAGTAQWMLGGREGMDAASRGRPVEPEPMPEPSLRVVIPVRALDETTLGSAEVLIRLTAILPAESFPAVLVGSSLRIRDMATGQLLSSGLDRPSDGGSQWVSATRTLTAPPVQLELSAPASAYLEPFQRAAQLGGVALLAVTLLAIALSAFLASRVVRSLEQLADAADAVAKGDLARTVGQSGGVDEVGRLGAAFNSMMESLRNTLARLSQRESLAAVGEFAASLSHEVRNALTSVSVDLRRAEEKLPSATPSRDLVLRALHNVKRLETIVGGALRLARSGQTPAQPVELQSITRSATALVEQAFSAHELEYRDQSKRSLWVRGDAIALEQLLVNLLFNALQALDDRGRVVISVLSANGKCEVAVTDNGRGLKPADLARIGEPFYTSRAAGSGLGLSIAKRIATAHGGELVLSSTIGEGTRAVVILDEISMPIASERSPAFVAASD